MEDRLNGLQAGERLVLLALGAIAAITASWWLLALWPVDAPPEWLSRTRAVCFGTGPTGLPGAGGWILLVGQPVGMLVFLMLVWGGSVRGALRVVSRRTGGRVVLASAMFLLAVGLAGAAARVLSAVSGVTGVAVEGEGRAVRLDRPAPPLRLTDQHGLAFTLDGQRGRRVLLTFAYAHCETVCPLVVRNVLAARAQVETDPPIVVVVTLDPWRDTPARLASIARQWRMREDDYVLSGDTPSVLEVLDDWDIPISRRFDTGMIDHPAVVYVVDAVGRVAYAAGGDAAGLADLVRRR